jgi:Ion transport protein
MKSNFYLAIASSVTRVQSGLWYNGLIILLAVGSLCLFAYEWVPDASPVLLAAIMPIDHVVAYIFLTDFFLGLFFNQNYSTRRAYFGDNWLSFISAIPVTSEVTQVLRAARVWRALRVIRIGVDIWTTHQQIVAQVKKTNK